MAKENHGDETSHVVNLVKATLASIIEGGTSRLQEAQRATAA